MHMEQRQHVQQSVPRPKCQGRADVVGRQTDAAWVSGTIFGRDELPEVSRIKASSALDANSPSTMRRRCRADKAERAGPLAGPGRQIDDGYAEGMGDALGSPNPCPRASTARIPANRRNSAAIRQR